MTMKASRPDAIITAGTAVMTETPVHASTAEVRHLSLGLIVGRLVGAVVVGVVLAGIALALGGDRLIPCGSERGFDALLGDQVNHVDGPVGGGGCIVPTAAAWGAAILGLLTPLLVCIAWILASSRSHAESA